MPERHWCGYHGDGWRAAEEDQAGEEELDSWTSAVSASGWAWGDGRRLTFTSSREGNFKVFVMDDDGSGVTRVTDHPAGDGYSTWRP